MGASMAAEQSFDVAGIPPLPRSTPRWFPTRRPSTRASVLMSGQFYVGQPLINRQGHGEATNAGRQEAAPCWNPSVYPGSREIPCWRSKSRKNV